MGTQKYVMNSFGGEKKPKLQKRGDIEIIRFIDSSSSDGQLEKWEINLNGSQYYLKAYSVHEDVELLDGNVCKSSSELYECESECIACRIADLFGLEDVIRYDMDTLELGSKKIKVCISADFIGDRINATYADLVDISKLYGKERYEVVVNRFPDLQEKLNKILLFDIIIGNVDRHLNNLIITVDDSWHLPLFDCGASLFGYRPDNNLKFVLQESFDYQKCKPFFNTVGQQIQLLRGTRLPKVTINDVAPIVDEFLDGKRAECVIKLLERNLQKVGDFLGWN